jgi:GMP synthase-like glutamine amidotransferase
VPLGSRWAVYDYGLRRTWVGAEMTMMRDALAAGVAALGVCFGGQLLAQALGGTVARSRAPEIGWYDIETDDPALVPTGPWFQWHFDRWTLPDGATEVARTATTSQAFVLGRALALQFHPELDQALLELWLSQDTDGHAAKLGLTHDELRSRTNELHDDAARRTHALIRGFQANVARRPAACRG